MQLKLIPLLIFFCALCSKPAPHISPSNPAPEDDLLIWEAMMASNEPAAQKIVMKKFNLEFGVVLRLKPDGTADEPGPQGAPCGLHSGNGKWRFSGKSIIVKMNVEYQDIDKTKKPKGDFVECKTIRRKYTYILKDFALVKNANAGYNLKVKREDGRLHDVSISRPEIPSDKQGSIIPEFEKGLEP